MIIVDIQEGEINEIEWNGQNDLNIEDYRKKKWRMIEVLRRKEQLYKIKITL